MYKGEKKEQRYWYESLNTSRTCTKQNRIEKVTNKRWPSTPLCCLKACYGYQTMRQSTVKQYQYHTTKRAGRKKDSQSGQSPQ